MENLISILGIAIFIGLAVLISQNRKKIDFKFVGMALALQFFLAIVLLGIPNSEFTGLSDHFVAINGFFVAIIDFTKQGTSFLFGPLLNVEKSGFILALQVLPVIIFLSSLMAVLYHIKVMQVVIQSFATLMHKTLKVSGSEALASAANIFLGQTEAPLLIRPLVKSLTRSELFTVMVGGMATVAGSVFAAYVGILSTEIPNIGGHLLTASILSAPAALLIAKIMIPETELSQTAKELPKSFKKSPYANVIDAAATGASEGLSLAVNVGAMLLAFIALIAMLNSLLTSLGDAINISSWGQFLSLDSGAEVKLTLNLIFGWVFAPFAWLMGIPSGEILLAGKVLGDKVIINEFVAYLSLKEFYESFSPRSAIILSYALCGFANFSSIAIQIGGIGGMAPERKKEIAKLGIRSIIGGTLAAFITASFASLLLV